jgi:uncharacterized protein (DUF736 family)
MSDIKDGMFAYIGGTISRVFHSKSGVTAVVEVQSPKRQYPDRVTVWGLSNASVGQRIKVKGWLSWTREEKDGKTYFNVSLNQPEVIAHETLPEISAEQVAKDILGADLVVDSAPF